MVIIDKEVKLSSPSQPMLKIKKQVYGMKGPTIYLWKFALLSLT